jgi:hypothetical protein
MRKMKEKETIETARGKCEDSTQTTFTDTKELAYSVLKQIGCSAQDTEDGRIRIEYQGVVFFMETAEEYPFVKLVWPWCYRCSLLDVEDFARVRKAMNEVNWFGRCALSYYSVPESDEAAVFIQKDFLLIPQIPQLDNYVKSIFNTFFGAARTLELEIEKARQKE